MSIKTNVASLYHTNLARLTILLSYRLRERSIWGQVGCHKIHPSKRTWIPKTPEGKPWEGIKILAQWKRETLQVNSTFGVPRTQSWIWSQAALAADSALDSFLALRISAPRCCTVVMNSVLSLTHSKYSDRYRKLNIREKRQQIIYEMQQDWLFLLGGNAEKACHWSSGTTSLTGFHPLPVFTVAWLASGYWVEEWFPQMITFFTSPTWTFSLSEIWPRALLWSSLVRQLMFFSGIEGDAKCFKISALVLAGFATTSTCMVRTWTDKHSILQQTCILIYR